MPRTCFVILPFSSTASCTKDEWTAIFEDVLKPAVEGSGLDYECRRSVATRGNIVGAIVQDLNDAYVVIADVTDQNPNVFYELGVRHALGNRSIILAQRRSDIPFDLQAYANHVYGWRTTDAKGALAEKLRELLVEVDRSPTRPDNPVSDFLERTGEPIEVPESPSIQPSQIAFAQPLAGPAADGLDVPSFVDRLAAASGGNPANLVHRLTRAELIPALSNEIAALNERPVPESAVESDVIRLANEYLGSCAPQTSKIEEFVLTSIERGWRPGLSTVGLRLAGDLISLTEKSALRIRLARGIPAFLAWRLLVLAGAKAVADEAFDLLGTVLREPIEVEERNGVTHRPLLARLDLFHPEAFLGYADRPIPYMGEAWERDSHLRRYFADSDDYLSALSKFLIIMSLAEAAEPGPYPLYPGYRLLPDPSRAAASLAGRVISSNEFLNGLARALGRTPEEVRANWPAWAKRVNEAELGSKYWPWVGRHLLPETLES